MRSFWAILLFFFFSLSLSLSLSLCVSSIAISAFLLHQVDVGQKKREKNRWDPRQKRGGNLNLLYPSLIHPSLLSFCLSLTLSISLSLSLSLFHPPSSSFSSIPFISRLPYIYTYMCVCVCVCMHTGKYTQFYARIFDSGLLLWSAGDSRMGKIDDPVRMVRTRLHPKGGCQWTLFIVAVTTKVCVINGRRVE